MQRVNQMEIRANLRKRAVHGRQNPSITHAPTIVSSNRVQLAGNAPLLTRELLIQIERARNHNEVRFSLFTTT